MCKIRFVLFLVLMVGLIGCSTAPSPTAVLPIESPTPTIQPTVTSSPAPTTTQKPVTPTMTPEPGLRTDGPYFGYFRDVPGRSDIQFVLTDADGGGRKVFDLPKNVTDASPMGTQYVSPDGKWLAFYTGYAGTPHKEDTQTTFDLTLNLFNLETGETQVVTPLLSHDYPNNFAVAINEINDPDGLIRPEALRAAFLSGIRSLAWSPDGKYLAFAGQMDGLSSDLYLYDMTTREIRLLSSNEEELQWIEWSPDGKWILEKHTLSSSPYTEGKASVVAVNNSIVHILESLVSGYWLNSHVILMYGFGGFQQDRQQMRLVDITTGKITEIWRDNFARYKLDPTGKWIAIDGFSGGCTIDEKLGMDCNVKLINLKSPQKSYVPEPVFEVVVPGFARFLRAPDGTIIASPNSMIAASPDVQYWVEIVYHDVKIYTQDLTLVKEISIPFQGAEVNLDSPYAVQWSPDSSSLTLVYGKRSYSRYFVNIPSGKVKLVDTDLSRISGGWFNVDQ
jgi:WD40 repeat protein